MREVVLCVGVDEAVAPGVVIIDVGSAVRVPINVPVSNTPVSVGVESVST